MKTRLRFSLVLGAIGLALAQAAFAAELTFRVPVNLSNLHPDVKRVRVVCGIGASESAPVNILTGFMSAPINIGADGAYRGTITVEINELGGLTPERRAAVRAWGCFLVLTNTVSGSALGRWVPPGLSGGPVWAMPKSGTPFSSQVHGPLRLE